MQFAGLTVDALLTALAVTVPDGSSLWGYDALAEAAGEAAAGLPMLKANVQVGNLVTAGANMLTNDSTLYATFAIAMNQAIAKKVRLSFIFLHVLYFHCLVSTLGRLLQHLPNPALPGADTTFRTQCGKLYAM